MPLYYIMWNKDTTRCLDVVRFRQTVLVGTGVDPGFNTQECTNKTLTTNPFGNTCEADEVSPKVEARVVVGLRCLQP
jgi:hypothetical protein